MIYNSVMSETEMVTAEIASSEAAIQVSAREKRMRWLEVSLVLLVACGSPFLNSLYLLKYGPSAMPHISNFRWAVGLVQEATGLLLLGYVLSRRGLKLKNLGLRWSAGGVGVGVLLAGVFYAAYVIGAVAIGAIHYFVHGSLALGPTGKDFFGHPSTLMIPFILLNPFFEELIVRAYLMTEVIELTGSSTAAIALSTAAQTSYHLYYGWWGALSLAIPFLALSIYFARTRRALPLIVTHGLFDIYAFIRMV